MSINLDALRAFVVLSEELNFGRTAARLNISQPALTKQIKRFEEEIGGRLFERTTGRVSLTAAGEALWERSRTLMNDAAAWESFARQAVRGEFGSLRIAFGIATLGDLLPRSVIAFRKAFPNVMLEMHDLASQAQMEGLLEGSIDLGFIRLPVSATGLEITPVLEEELLIAVSQSRFTRTHLALKDLRHEPFVLISRSISKSLRQHTISVCAAAGFTPTVIQEVGELFTVLNLVRAGLGVSLVPSTARRMRVPGVRFLPISTPAAKWKIGMAWRKDRYDRVRTFAAIVQSIISV
jgi:DNA-binding transcriptional LysR family regulator